MRAASRRHRRRDCVATRLLILGCDVDRATGASLRRGNLSSLCRRTKKPGSSGLSAGRIAKSATLHAGGPDLDGFVAFSEIPSAEIDRAISEQIDHFKRLNCSFEWKLHAFDSPADLASRLESQGFVRGEEEAFMVYPVTTAPPPQRESSFKIERVTTPAGIRHIVAVQQDVWGASFPWLEKSLSDSRERTAFFCAYDGETPVGTGWIEFPQGSSFAELHGGAIVSTHRGRGLYSSLFRARVGEAWRRGVPFIAADAAPMSRPILARKGFQYVCDTLPFRKES